VKLPILLAALATAPIFAAGAQAEPLAAVPDYRPKLDSTIEFPAPERATRKSGAFVAPHNVVMITPGTTKSQIYTLLDVPHFQEGFNVKRWNYILNFYTGNGDEYVACQYQIRFAAKGRVEQTYFQTPECAALLDRLLAPPSPPPSLSPAVAAVDPTLPARTYDFTFAFDSAEVGPQGLAALREAAAEVRRGGYREVIVTGFTDTMGSIQYNDALAARRAAAAADILRGQVGQVPVYSRASRDLKVTTSTQIREERNRMVQVELYSAAIERPTPTTVR
jgi:outer membrane protein OmpA-like peptidoglycan-associated protein